ncbi:DUF11 domain-containing protein [bacterium]|nr:DUF11 domain-containing protein [bacterium]
MRSRTLFRAAAATAAVGLAALATVVAQQPPPARLPPAGSPPPATTVRPYSEWTPTPAPPGGYTPKQGGVVQTGGVLPPPPGYTPVPPGTKGRLTSPVMAGPEGVRPAGGFDLPPPNLDIPGTKAGGGVPAVPLPETSGSKFPPAPDAAGSKFVPLPVPNDPKPPVPVVPPAGGVANPPALLPAPGALPPPPALVPPAGATPAPSPLVPVPPPVSAPAALPPVGPTSPPVVAPPTVTQPLPAPPAATVPAAPPAVNPAPTPAAAPPTVSPDAKANPAATPDAKASPAVPPTPAAALPPRTTPSVVVETVCPDTVSFGQEYQYKLIVRNGGTAPVAHVRVENEIPAGARFVGCEPQGELNGDRIVWALGALDAGAERHLNVRVKAGDEGEARTRATVTFAAVVAGRTHVTRPRLAATVRGPESARAGEEAVFRIQVTNSGSGPANRVLVQATLSDGLYHAQAQKGGLIEAELPMVKAGEVRTVDLKLGAAKAGLQSLQIVTAADGSPDASAKAAMNVVEPMLVVRQSGPGKCLVGGTDPTFDIELTNPGTAATDPVQVHSVLPDGFDFASASDGGAANGRTVSWRLPSLPAGGSRKVTLRVRATSATDGSPLRTVAQSVPAEVTPAGATAGAPGVSVRPAGRGLEARAESVIAAEGVAAIRFDVTGLENPVMVGREATYEIKVSNRGTGPCQNVQLVAVLADGTEMVGATTGATNQAATVRAQGQQIAFEAIPVLGVRAEQVYRVRVRSGAPGDLRFRVQLTSDQLRTPLVKEESTTFYMEQR